MGILDALCYSLCFWFFCICDFHVSILLTYCLSSSEGRRSFFSLGLSQHPSLRKHKNDLSSAAGSTALCFSLDPQSILVGVVFYFCFKLGGSTGWMSTRELRLDWILGFWRFLSGLMWVVVAVFFWNCCLRKLMHLSTTLTGLGSWCWLEVYSMYFSPG